MAQSEANGLVTYVGIDVCKQWLDVAAGVASPRRLGRDAVELTAWLRSQERPLHTVVEATGGLEQVVAEVCSAEGVAYSLVNPLRVRQFAKTTGRLAKTDRVDALVLAEYGRATEPRASRLPSAAQTRLRALVERRRDLILARSAEKNRLKQSKCVSAMVAARSKPRLKAFYERLLAAHKPPKVALTAVARKLLTMLNAMQRDGTCCQSKPLALAA